MYTEFHPGKVWLDTDGNRIQAHGGSVMYLNGKYYWCGENKEKTDGKNGIWHWGIRCYSSTDLYNWKSEGIIIPPDVKDEKSPLNPKASMDRPHIIYNKKTKKFVCWLKVMQSESEQSMTILTADNILGPYTIVKKWYKPLQMNSGDFDLVVGSDGKAYIYFERCHTETICADLTEDYCGVTGYYSTHFPYGHPPYVREATAHFQRDGKHYLITSGTTGYLPNPSMAAVADTWHGPYEVLGNPHVGDKSNTSFHSQISSIFKVQNKKDLYIACADRWLPEAMDKKYEIYEEMFNAIYENREFDFSKMGDQPVQNTSIADYVWLPIEFDGKNVKIHWKDEWNLDDFK
ncbi:hypothetical protein J2Z60_001433 [Lactobacillus colini]|uniref:Family 43 glycosylhydrolase n=1 Tax=Lactobacillus colini TaxID=1819254 RepID=A0ABS4MF09_9LACO|nr:family 43 glycosylhydrolase [Lactobacillus colini]MBP2058256.1 hypothetical protein [Lactobacillus colini]